MNITDDNQYPGGKGVSGLAGWIIRQLPSHTLCIEPFAGKAAVTRRPARERAAILRELIQAERSLVGESDSQSR